MNAFDYENKFNLGSEFEEDLEYCEGCGLAYLPHTMNIVKGFYHKPKYVCDECLDELWNNPDADPSQWVRNDDNTVAYKHKTRKQIDLFKTLGEAMRPGGAI